MNEERLKQFNSRYSRAYTTDYLNRLAFDKHSQAVLEVHSAFARELHQEYAPNLTIIQSGLVFTLAYTEGHDKGTAEVSRLYQAYAAMIKAVRGAA